MRFAEYRSLGIPAGASTFEVLWALSADILGVEEATLLAACNRRMATFANRQRWAEDLAQLGEAAELLERNDAARVAEEQNAAAKAGNEERDFRQSYAKKAREVSDRSAAGQAGKRKPSRQPKVKRIQIPTFPEHQIEVTFARSFAPPGGVAVDWEWPRQLAGPLAALSKGEQVMAPIWRGAGVTIGLTIVVGSPCPSAWLGESGAPCRWPLRGRSAGRWSGLKLGGLSMGALRTQRKLLP